MLFFFVDYGDCMIFVPLGVYFCLVFLGKQMQVCFLFVLSYKCLALTKTECRMISLNETIE
jgi:hypothetical protein